MANATIKVKGLKELDRAFRQMSKEIQRELRDELEKAAEPVAASARSKLGRYRGASLGTIRPIALARGVVVRQTHRKTTGLRPDFGALQMRVGFLPALDENVETVERDVESMIDNLASKNGF